MSNGQKTATPLTDSRRVIIKIGSSLLVDAERGHLKTEWLAALAGDIARLKGRGQEVLVVSSGAIALGRHALGLPRGELRLEENRAAAAAGQIHLAHAYEEALRPHNITIAQILLTLTDSEQRRRYLNARSTLNTLLALGAVPIINENDTVATTEIRYGDNDRLAARIAQMVSADCLVLLSDIDGLYTADPGRNPEARHIARVTEITPEIEAMATRVSPRDAMRLGSGGMVTKLMAARICLGAGCHMVIAGGHGMAPLSAIEAGARCTWFVPHANPVTARKQWISGALDLKGTLTVDAGAAEALARGKSLLPAGITAVDGRFERGDAVRIVNQSGEELARGLTAYDDQDARIIMGHKSGEIPRLLGYRGRTAMIHADDLVLTAGKGGRSGLATDSGRP